MVDRIKGSNWSGDNVLYIAGKLFPTDKAKTALNKQDYDIWRPGVLGVLHACRRQVRVLVESGLFNGIIMLFVLLNTLLLATEGLITDTDTLNALSTMNTVFTFCFTAEMALKIFALGITGKISFFLINQTELNV